MRGVLARELEDYGSTGEKNMQRYPEGNCKSRQNWKSKRLSQRIVESLAEPYEQPETFDDNIFKDR